MSKPLANGGWAPDPKPEHTAEAYRLLEADYVQTSRRYRSLSRALDDTYHPALEPGSSVQVSIDTFAEFKRLGGSTHTEAASIRLEIYGQRWRFLDGLKTLQRSLKRAFATVDIEYRDVPAMSRSEYQRLEAMVFVEQHRLHKELLSKGYVYDSVFGEYHPKES